MKIKRFFAKDMRTALKEVKDELGVDAVIMSNKKLADGVEIVAAIDHERPAAAPKSAPEQQMQPRATEQRMVRPQTRTQRPEPQSHNGVADSLQALLERQSPKPKNAALADMFSQSGIDMSAPEEPVEQPQRRAAPANHYAPQPTLAEPTQARAAAQSMGDDLDGDGFDEPHRQPNDSVQQEGMDSEEISAMRDEMNAIRQLLEHQVSGLLHQDRARRDPTRACFIERLQGMGIDTEVAEQLVR